MRIREEDMITPLQEWILFAHLNRGAFHNSASFIAKTVVHTMKNQIALSAWVNNKDSRRNLFVYRCG